MRKIFLRRLDSRPPPLFFCLKPVGWFLKVSVNLQASATQLLRQKYDKIKLGWEEPELTRKLRGVKGEEAIKVFIRAGGQIRGGKGDHINIKMPNGKLITIPGNKELKTGLLLDAIKKADLTAEEFEKLLKGRR